MFAVEQSLHRYAATLSDQELANAIRVTERCARCSFRCGREGALRRLQCLRREMESRRAAGTVPQTLARS